MSSHDEFQGCASGKSEPPQQTHRSGSLPLQHVQKLHAGFQAGSKTTQHR
jgi:hypothetical protein